MNDMQLSLDALLVFLVLTGAVFALIGSSAGQAARPCQTLAWFHRGHDIGSRTNADRSLTVVQRDRRCSQPA